VDKLWLAIAKISILTSLRPRGEQWLHEVKCDGWRIQLHKHGRSVAAFTRMATAHKSIVFCAISMLQTRHFRGFPSVDFRGFFCMG
jgi:hypothetical protein